MKWYKEASEKKWKRVDSTFIKAVSYDKDLHTLSVRLKGGVVYNFKDVTKDIYKDLIRSQSKGKFFNKSLKDQYEWNKE